MLLADVEAVARRKAQGKTAVVSPIALEAVKRIDALFGIERAINGRSAAERLEPRRQHSAPLVADLHGWLQQERAKIPRRTGVAAPIDYMLRR